MTQRKPLGKKEITFIKAKVAGKSNTEAAMLATGAKTKDVAKTQGHRLSTNVNVQEALAAAFEAHGITVDAAVAPIGEGLKATRVVIHGNKEEAFAEVEPDHSIRLKASGMALGLMGLGKQSGDVTINFINQSSEQRQVYDL